RRPLGAALGRSRPRDVHGPAAHRAVRGGIGIHRRALDLEGGRRDAAGGGAPVPRRREQAAAGAAARTGRLTVDQLLVLGDCNPDLVISGGRLEPAFGQVEQLVDEARLVIGGSGAITACGAARLGVQTALVSLVGDDHFGRFMLEAVAETGVDVSGCVTDDGRPTGVTVVLSRGDDRAILTAPGTIAALSGEHVDLGQV